MMGSSDPTDQWWGEKLQTLNTGQPPRVDVFVRSLSPPLGAYQPQERVLDRFQTLEQQGTFDAVNVNVWGKSFDPESTAVRMGSGKSLLQYIERARSWGRSQDVPVELPFEERAVSSIITDEQSTKIVLPRVCLGVYTDDQLELVVPGKIDGTSYSVDDFLSYFERRSSRELEVKPSA